ncbi:MAG: SH3 domain-containing protein [Anaerolineae bacterium]|nr:SH3 domain-containing protein [Anaerolineae bacterium]
MSRKLFAALLLILLSALPVLHAQDNLTCPAPADIVASVAEACANLEADQVCLARAGVTADTGTDSAFAQPGDRVTAGALAQLVTTAPTADSADFGAVLLNLRANLSRDTVRALVLGGAQIANTNDARLVLPASFRDVGRVRSSPSTTNDDNIMTTLQGGASVTAVARNDAGDWVQISFGDGELGWAATFLLYVEGDVNQLSTTPAAAGTVYGSPLQAFNLIGAPAAESACAELPAGGVLVHTPPETRALLVVNGVHVSFTSTLYLTLGEEVGRPALRVEVYAGEATVQTDYGAALLVPGVYASVPLSPDFATPLAEPFPARPNPAGRDVQLAPLTAAVTADGTALALTPSLDAAQIDAAIAQAFAPDGLLAGTYQLVNAVSTPFTEPADWQCGQDMELGLQMRFAPNIADVLEENYGVRIVAGQGTNGVSLNTHNDPQYRTVPETNGEVAARSIIVRDMLHFTLVETWARREGDFAAACNSEFTWEWVAP